VRKLVRRPDLACFAARSYLRTPQGRRLLFSSPVTDQAAVPGSCGVSPLCNPCIRSDRGSSGYSTLRRSSAHSRQTDEFAGRVISAAIQSIASFMRCTVLTVSIRELLLRPAVPRTTPSARSPQPQLWRLPGLVEDFASRWRRLLDRAAASGPSAYRDNGLGG
jgi:hypothetical protein